MTDIGTCDNCYAKAPLHHYDSPVPGTLKTMPLSLCTVCYTACPMPQGEMRLVFRVVNALVDALGVREKFEEALHASDD